MKLHADMGGSLSRGQAEFAALDGGVGPVNSGWYLFTPSRHADSKAGARSRFEQQSATTAPSARPRSP